jgi:thiol-disulfide isomerase/thioredoxin
MLKRRMIAPTASVLLALFVGCGSSQPKHGKISSLSVAEQRDWEGCEHEVPKEVCVQCDPSKAATFKAKGDWCPEHDRPESQCLLCHPDLNFSPPTPPPAGADVVEIVELGEDLPALEPHRATGKITVFDFYASWCPPCRVVDEYLHEQLEERSDLAIRRINVMDWDSPVAQRWLTDVRELPYLVIFDSKGRNVAKISGAKLKTLDRTLRETR